MSYMEAKNLSVGYEGEAACENISFTVNPGDYLCIVGENGSGKSTLMKTILGLVKPISGEIKTGDGLSRKEIGYLPQQTIVQKDFPASVKEIVLSGCQARVGLRPFYNKEEKALAKKTWRDWELRILQTVVTGIFPADSSKEFCSPEHSARPEKFYCWMNRYRA